MSWDAIGAIGSIVGSVAVVRTLVYLALQMKQNTKALTTSTYETAMGHFRHSPQWNLWIATVLIGVSFSLVPAVMWPLTSKVVSPAHFGTALGFGFAPLLWLAAGRRQYENRASESFDGRAP